MLFGIISIETTLLSSTFFALPQCLYVKESLISPFSLPIFYFSGATATRIILNCYINFDIQDKSV
jgi:hypothetical protein